MEGIWPDARREPRRGWGAPADATVAMLRRARTADRSPPEELT